jgi:hypothetical protein
VIGRALVGQPRSHLLAQPTTQSMHRDSRVWIQPGPKRRQRLSIAAMSAAVGAGALPGWLDPSWRDQASRRAKMTAPGTSLSGPMTSSASITNLASRSQPATVLGRRWWVSTLIGRPV